MGIRGKLLICAAAVVLTASGFTGIYLSAWGTAHVRFGDAFKAWLAQSGASVSAQAPVTLDADRGGFTMPAPADDHLDTQGRMVYPGALTITISGPAKKLSLRLGPFHVGVVPAISWTAGLSVDGTAAGDELPLAAGDLAEVLAGGGSPSPSGFRAASVPFHLARETVDLLSREAGLPGPVAGSLFGTLVPQFDHMPTRG